MLRVLVIHGRAKIALPAGERAPQWIAAVLLAAHLRERSTKVCLCVSRMIGEVRVPGMIGEVRKCQMTVSISVTTLTMALRINR